jgi:hypothetical protein
MPELTEAEVTLTDDTVAPRGHACGACGAPVETLDRFCNACGTPQEEVEEIVEAELVQRHFRCEACGAEVAIDADQRSYTCAFCDSTYVVEFSPQESDRQPPEFVIGFSITPEEAQEKFRQWLTESRWFRPGDLIAAKVVEKLRGVYLPFWSFSMLAESSWSATIGEYWYRTETYTTTENGKTVTKTRQVRETEWWPLSGQHHRYYSGYLISGSQGLGQRDAERIKPFYLNAMKRYRPYFLAGWLSEEYSITRPDALEICQNEFYRQEESNIGTFLPGDTSGNLQVTTGFDHINSDLVLLPIYLLSYNYKDTVYRFLINGQTGKMAGDKPLSKLRIGAAIGAGLLALLLVFLVFALLSGAF